MTAARPISARTLRLGACVVERAPDPYPVAPPPAMRYRVTLRLWPGRGVGCWSWWRDSLREAYALARRLDRVRLSPHANIYGAPGSATSPARGRQGRRRARQVDNRLVRRAMGEYSSAPSYFIACVLTDWTQRTCHADGRLWIEAVEAAGVVRP